MKTKQTKRTCSIYSLLLTHLKEHTGLPSCTPQNVNVFRVYCLTAFSLKVLGKILWRVLLRKELWAGNLGLRRHPLCCCSFLFVGFLTRLFPTALLDRPRSRCLDPSTYWPYKLGHHREAVPVSLYNVCTMGLRWGESLSLIEMIQLKHMIGIQGKVATIFNFGVVFHLQMRKWDPKEMK